MNSVDFTHFEKLLDHNFEAAFGNNQSVLRNAVRYSLIEVPGKRLRPQLVYASANTLGLAHQLVDPVALALEAIHCFSLIHDDLPCMDNDDFRRGKPSSHKVFGEAQALLAGDAILVLAQTFFSSLALKVGPEVFYRSFQYFQMCTGHLGMIGGQSQELEGTKTDQQVLKVYEAKTGALFNAAICIPAIIAQSHEPTRTFEIYQDFSRAFGLAFQLADDLDDHSIPEDQWLRLRDLILPQLKSHPLSKEIPWTTWLIQKIENPKFSTLI